MITKGDPGHLVLRYVGERTVPFILLFALYVLAYGEDAPGGGFQGGVIFGAGFVLYALVHGWGPGRDLFPESLSDALLPTGALIYAGVGVVTLLLGGMFLEYEIFAGGSHDHHDVHLAHHVGLIGIEMGVMITVSAAMVTLFFEMSRPRAYIDVPRRRRMERATRDAEA